MILDAFNGVLVLIFLIGVGFILGRLKWFDENSNTLLTKLVVYISLPTFMLSNLTTSFTKEQLIQWSSGFLIVIISILLTYSIGFIITRAFKVSPERKGVFRSLFGLSNTIFIGLPVNIAIFGEKALPFILIYYVVNTLSFWSIATYDIKCDCKDVEKNILSLDNIRSIFSPPLIAFILSITLIMLQVNLPKFIIDGCKYLGSLTTPLSTLFIGSILATMDFEELRLNKDSLLIIIGRFILSPLVTYVFLTFTSLPILMKQVFIVMSAMPVMNTSAIVARRYGGDYRFATAMNAVTLIVSFIFIPIYIFLFQYIFK